MDGRPGSGGRAVAANERGGRKGDHDDGDGEEAAPGDEADDVLPAGVGVLDRRDAVDAEQRRVGDEQGGHDAERDGVHWVVLLCDRWFLTAGNATSGAPAAHRRPGGSRAAAAVDLAGGGPPPTGGGRVGARVDVAAGPDR